MNGYSEIQRFDTTSTGSKVFPAPRNYWHTVVSGTHEAVDAAATLFGREGERMQWGRYRIVRVLEIPTVDVAADGCEPYKQTEHAEWLREQEGDSNNWRVR